MNGQCWEKYLLLSGLFCQAAEIPILPVKGNFLLLCKLSSHFYFFSSWGNLRIRFQCQLFPWYLFPLLICNCYFLFPSPLIPLLAYFLLLLPLPPIYFLVSCFSFSNLFFPFCFFYPSLSVAAKKNDSDSWPLALDLLQRLIFPSLSNRVNFISEKYQLLATFCHKRWLIIVE